MIATNLRSATERTEGTERTINVSNQDFLEVIFRNSTTEKKPLVVSFLGSPEKVAKAAWAGRAWEVESSILAPQANNYFSLATFRPDEAGIYRRRKNQFSALHAIMLDDIGTKVPMERLSLPPTWLIETSQGNYQAGYLLTTPLADSKLADSLVNAIIVAELCDPGANGPCSRLARLPVAINGKNDEAFHCRLELWAPDLTYSTEELVEGLEIEVISRDRTKGKSRRSESSTSPHTDGDSVWIPKPSENLVISALRRRGLYKFPTGPGKHDISCPWVTQHTGSIDDGSAYFEPADNWPIGGFKCMHGHCKDRHIKDLLAVLEVEPSEARMKAKIKIVAGEIHRVTDAAEKELAMKGLYYQRGGLIVTVSTDPSTRDTKIRDISQPALVSALAGVATWERYDLKVKHWVRTDPPARHVSVLHDSTGYNHLPIIKGISRQPYLRPDSSFAIQPGYDSETGMFGVFDARAFSVPLAPSRKEAEKALETLRDLLSEFSFASETDRSASISALLTASIRPSLPLAPMFHVRAHMAGSGKSFLCELISAFATPQRGNPTSFPSDDEECRKFLLAELLGSPAVIEFDNLTGDLVPLKSLCTALTSEYMSGRILGFSKTATVGTRVLFLSSGNNVGPVQDMARRCITINISPECEIPAARTYRKPNLIQEVLNERGRYVSAAHTIIRAWTIAGRPLSICKPLASYVNWSDLCRQPIMWLGCPDPTASVFEAMREDPDREVLLRLMEAWMKRFGKVEVMVKDLVKPPAYEESKHLELLEVLMDIAGDRGGINNRKLGWWIRRHSGQIVEGRRIVRAMRNNSAERWRIEELTPVS